MSSVPGPVAGAGFGGTEATARRVGEAKTAPDRVAGVGFGERKTSAGLVVGVDIGGTKTAAGLVDPSGALLASATRPTPAAEGCEAILDTAAELVRSVAGDRWGSVTAVGVGSAGVIDPERGVVVSATTSLTGWAGTDLRGGLSRRLGGLPVATANDVHAHALGEHWRGAAAGCADVLLVAVGTGVGASIVLGGRVRHGPHAVAGHAGHVPVPAAAGAPCPCGGTGHVEAVASGPALLAEYLRRGGTRAADLAGVARLAAAGDPLATDVLITGGTALGQAIGGLMNVIDPEVVVIGGGVTGCGDPWWQPVRAAIAAETLPALRDVPIVPAALPSTAALLGAARLPLTTTPTAMTTATATRTPDTPAGTMSQTAMVTATGTGDTSAGTLPQTAADTLPRSVTDAAAEEPPFTRKNP